MLTMTRKSLPLFGMVNKVVTMSETERALMRLLVKHAKETSFNISAAARALGVDRKTVRYHLTKKGF